MSTFTPSLPFPSDSYWVAVEKGREQFHRSIPCTTPINIPAPLKEATEAGYRWASEDAAKT